MAKILVTGGAGFIGSNLINKLHKRKHKISVFDINPNHQFLNGLKIKRIAGDVRDYGSVLKAVEGCDYVYHLASCNLGTADEKDRIFGENVMKAWRECKVRRVVHVSSGSALGFKRNPNEKLTEKDCLDFKDQLYGQSKKQGEDKVQEYVSKGLDAVIIMPSYVVGVGEIEPARFGIFQSIIKGSVKFAYPGGGGTAADADLPERMSLAMEKGKTGERYILSNENLTLFDNYNMIARLLGKPR